MKIICSILLLVVAFTANCQIKKRTTQARRVSAVTAPVYYIDSVQVVSLIFFDRNKIEKMNVVKDNDPAAPNGKVYITIKKTTPVKWLTIKDILRQQQLPDSTAYLFMINDNIITDTLHFCIDTDFVMGIEVIKVSAIENLPNNLPNLQALKFFTGNKENAASQKVVRIKTKASS